MKLLLAALVLAWGIVPPAIRHGHEGGEDARHRHDAVAHHEHDHAHHGHSHDEDSQPVGAVVSADVLGGLVVHLHWSFLGLDFSVPLSEHEEPTDERNAAKPAIVRLVDSLPTPAVDSNHWASSTPVTVSQSGLDLAVVQNPPLASLRPTRSVSLCDRARHERSGVLLV